MLGAVVLLCFSIPDSTQESGCQQGEATGDKVAGSFYIALDFLELTMHTRLSLKLMENFLLLLGLMACTTPTGYFAFQAARGHRLCRLEREESEELGREFTWAAFQPATVLSLLVGCALALQVELHPACAKRTPDKFC